VMMEYLDARDERTQRIIEPRTIRRRKGELILIAHCQLRQAQRTFKLERIVQLTRIEGTAPVPNVALMAPPTLMPSPVPSPKPIELDLFSLPPSDGR